MLGIIRASSNIPENQGMLALFVRLHNCPAATPPLISLHGLLKQLSLFQSVNFPNHLSKGEGIPVGILSDLQPQVAVQSCFELFAFVGI